MQGKKEECIQGFGRETSRQETTWNTYGWGDNIKMGFQSTGPEEKWAFPGY
jgi:hypothetical protein